ncbi:MAG TPA: hypothetical protein PLT82_06830 [Candidatus Hydrogenedens sp.]|nr:hypothetical protein [Candidatus Hydrogenedens sp.]HOK08871.1 hypothetical protein [Candidatus Hydrogenedens sp.]HOL20361.1 hypothetical protein [Candidatus Hydrogenedens sp.]HPP58832.1 hypothetical protein [Candidatus Hydrogenedens sp.]
MKHVRMISSKRPVYAGWMDNVCFVSFLINKLLTAMGGQSPFFSFLEGKCHIETGTGNNNSSSS